MGETVNQEGNQPQLEAVFLYRGILDAYDAVGTELIGPNVLDEHVLPRMVYFVKEFLPEIFSRRADSNQLVEELKTFLAYFHKKVDEAQELGSLEGLTMDEIWKLRAAIFGYESVFINILGEAAIKDYVFVRMADILASYLPENLLDSSVSLDSKLKSYAKYITEHGFVKYARASADASKISVAANGCAFARIHDSEAYQNLNVRFCPWGMIGSAIVAAHEGKGTILKSSIFTTRGSVSEIETK
ncbi:hypothetical protein EU528_06415 [Candidatus Thorarchaeota archaeon]|nr:MAG: hypothetical protein EU528_06415 [Candidatus Thorarchaeota archaeon]